MKTAKLGNYVRIIGQSKIGRVYEKNHFFEGTGETMEWLEMQTLIQDKEKALTEPWYNILMDDGGAISIPEQNIIEVLGPQFEDQISRFTNAWESFYF